MKKRKNSPEELITVFVYGTIRPGESNDWALDAAVRVYDGATTAGSLYVGTGFSFPHAFFGGDGTITGTLAVMDRSHPNFQQMVNMELGAGYKVAVIQVHHGDNEVEAVAFEALHRPGKAPAMPTGNWFDHPRSMKYRLAQYDS